MWGKLKITKVGSNIALNITSRLSTRPKAPPPPSYWAEHILCSALHKDITFSHLFLSTFFFIPFWLHMCSVFLSIYMELLEGFLCLHFLDFHSAQCFKSLYMIIATLGKSEQTRWTLWDHSKSPLRAHTVPTQRTLKDLSQITQWSLRCHSENM